MKCEWGGSKHFFGQRRSFVLVCGALMEPPTAPSATGAGVSPRASQDATLKVSLKRLLDPNASFSDEISRRLQAASERMDEIQRRVYELLGIYIRHPELFNEKLPIAHHAVIRGFIYAVTSLRGNNTPNTAALRQSPRERKLNPRYVHEPDSDDEVDTEVRDDDQDEEDITDREYKNFYQDALQIATKLVHERYLPLRRKDNLELIDRSGIPGGALVELANHIAASIKTNIERHFWQRQRQHLQLRDAISKKDTRERAALINDEVDRRLANQQTWQADDSLPNNLTKSIAYTLAAFPERFIAPMQRMNELREKNNWPLFAVLPLPTGFRPTASLHLCTESFVALMSSKVLFSICLSSLFLCFSYFLFRPSLLLMLRATRSQRR